MKGFTFGLTRRVENHWIDVDKSHDSNCIVKTYKDDSPNGLYTSIIVPEYLNGRKVIIIPVDEENSVMTLEEAMDGLK